MNDPTSKIEYGNRVSTPSGRTGIVIEPEGNAVLPLYALVLFPSGDKQWYLARILSVVSKEQGQNEVKSTKIRRRV